MDDNDYMDVFTEKMNPITGVNDIILEHEDYDLHQEIAKAAFADMLHDTERNQLYEQALKAGIDKKHSEGKKAHVLDIGTGTGLLSMMAVRNGADSVTACEAFKPMSECAAKIIALNGYADKIKIIPKRSTDITVGEQGDMKELCNILVTEVFDTELIGKGALSTFKHAHKFLLEKGSIVVPESVTIFAQVVECPLAQDWNKLKDVFNDDGELLLKVPKTLKSCAGSAAVHNIQLSELPQDAFNTIVSPVPVLLFDWSGRTPFIFERSTINTVKAERDGKAQAVFMWWELQMDTESKIILSCAPIWAHPLTKVKQKEHIPWRDHWMQAVYYLPNEVDVTEGQEINLISCHDEYSLWFNLVDHLGITDIHYLKPVCNCELHVNFSRTRIGQMNNSRRNKKYLALFEEQLDKDSCVLVLGHGFYFALSAVKLGVKKMYVLETNSLQRRILSDFISSNNMKNVEVVPTSDKLNEIAVDVNVILGEPYFSSSILPWGNLFYYYVKRAISHDVQIFPQRVLFRAVAVHFKDLYKIRSPLGSCEGFKMEAFDRLIEASSNITDDNVEPQPLWQYPGFALSKIEEILSLDMIYPPQNVTTCNGTFSLQGELECNGVVIWTDWYLTNSPKSLISTGPVSPIEIGAKIDWDKYTRQGVCLFPSKKANEIKYTFTADFKHGNITFKCS